MSDTPTGGKRPGAFVRFVRGLWNAVNFSRRLVFNILFVLVVIFVIALLFAGGPVLQERTALVLAPEGAIVEQYSVDPVSRAFARAMGDEVPEVQLRDLLRAIDRAGKDPRIERLVIRPDGITSMGLSAAREIAQALQAFKDTGKQLVAYGDAYDQRQYLLAAQADEVYLHPEGAVLLEGLASYRPYFREALEDKLAIDVHVFRVGEYKSAVEPFILDAPSPESQEADLYWMNDLWDRHLADIGQARGVDPAALSADIAQLDARVAAFDGDLARLALDQGLVDELRTQDQVRDLLIERGVATEDGDSFRQVNLVEYINFLDRETLPIDPRPQVAVVVAQGTIVEGDQPAGTVGGVSTSKLLREAREDENVAAVVLRVDSPGGGVFASEQIRREVVLTQQAGKPVVVSMGDVAASGGYWISMNADEIWANPSTITGSIGIFGLFMTLDDTLEKIGVNVEGVGTTPIAGAFDPTRALDPMVGNVIQSVIEKGYRDFIGKVADARGMSVDAVDEVARGRVWSGAQAQDRGLVDQLGGLGDAIASAASHAELEPGEFGVRYIEKDLTPFEQFVASMTTNSAARAVIGAVGVPEALLPETLARSLAHDLDVLRSAARRPFGAVAHCFCEL